ncbi:MAG: hypothetical protein QM734_05720 [Cyclobacteriaceae bacterium]
MKHLPISTAHLSGGAGTPGHWFTPLNAARTHHPWLAKSAFGYIVTEYAAIRELVTDQ